MTNPTIRPGHEEGRCDRLGRHGRRAHEFLYERRGALFALTAVSLVLTAGATATPGGMLSAASASPTQSLANAGSAAIIAAQADSDAQSLRVAALLKPAAIERAPVPAGGASRMTPAALSRPVSSALLPFAVAAPVVPVRVVPPRVSTARRGAPTAMRAVGPTYVGRASWYGPGFQGRRTANGERFNTQSLTAAHKSLPFGTRLRVCRQKQCVVVRVNDRGPFVRGRMLDLSSRAAQAIGLVASGVSTVSATVIAPEPARTEGTWAKKRS